MYAAASIGGYGCSDTYSSNLESCSTNYMSQSREIIFILFALAVLVGSGVGDGRACIKRVVLGVLVAVLIGPYLLLLIHGKPFLPVLYLVVIPYYLVAARLRGVAYLHGVRPAC